MKYYVLSLNDWEEYEPRWFACECSKADFKKAVREAMAEATVKLTTKKRQDYINGHRLLEIAVPLLKKKGFQLLRADYELQFYGACLYSKGSDRRPTVIPAEAWKKILAHNESVSREMDERCRNGFK